MSSTIPTTTVTLNGKTVQTTGFDATKLKAGDVVLLEGEVRCGLLDEDGEIVIDFGSIANAFVRTEHIVGLVERPPAVGDQITPIEHPGVARELLAIVSVKGVDYAVFEPFDEPPGAVTYLTAERLGQYRRAE